MIEIGSRVRSLLGGSNLNMIGTVLYIKRVISNIFIEIQVESCIKPHRIGSKLFFCEKNLELVNPIPDPTSTYQLCIDCQTLTSNKVKSYYVCCHCKSRPEKIYA